MGTGGEAAAYEDHPLSAFELGEAEAAPISAEPDSGLDARQEVSVEFDPVAEDRYWAETYNAHPYAYDLDYKAFQPACRYGWESFLRHPGRSFDEVEPQLKASWEQYRGESDTEWARARAAARAAWNRLGRAFARGRHRRPV